MLRSIFIAPAFPNLDAINALRTIYDPLAAHIPPHITMVFPFESDLGDHTLVAHVRDALAGMESFAVELREITGDYREGYLFLNVKRGNDGLIALHDRLYGGLLETYRNRRLTYCPHMTVGRLADGTAFNQALAEMQDFKGTFMADVDRVYLERIGESGQSYIICTHPL